ncbi:DUF296 domain-containing protein [Candidatus Aerophobetes bacterium]|nr:DUF296 domain-containing protein [Candidatus Aerophobetes bacterium]
MKYSEGKTGRVFVVRLEDREKLPEAIEAFAREKNILRGVCIILGGAAKGKIVTGPKDAFSEPVVPLIHAFSAPHEIAGVGTIFPDEEGIPSLHLHVALGRGEEAKAGCIRTGIEVSRLGEVIILEIVENSARRKMDSQSGFMVLEP